MSQTLAEPQIDPGYGPLFQSARHQIATIITITVEAHNFIISKEQCTS